MRRRGLFAALLAPLLPRARPALGSISAGARTEYITTSDARMMVSLLGNTVPAVTGLKPGVVLRPPLRSVAPHADQVVATVRPFLPRTARSTSAP